LFFATAFDRDRAMMRLQQDNTGDNNHENERVAPRLDKRKVQCSVPVGNLFLSCVCVYTSFHMSPSLVGNLIRPE
jgi:hypothetical protein